MAEQIETETKKRKRSQKSIQTEETILESARELIVQHGFESTTTRDIALAAQIAEGTLFHHFPSKVALLGSLMRDYYARLNLVAENIYLSDLPPAERLRQLCANHLAIAEAEWEIVRAFSHYGRSPDSDLVEPFYQHNRSYTRLFSMVIEQLKGSLVMRRSVPTSLIRDTLFGSMEHFMIRHFTLRRGEADINEYVDQLMDLVFFGAGGGDGHGSGSGNGQ